MPRRSRLKTFYRDGTQEGVGGSAPLLSCRRVSIFFGALVAINKLSFELEKGIILGIGGPNGAGKTTLFDALSGLHSPDTGDILLNGRSISGLPPHEICHAGIARTFQLNAFFGTMSVMENALIASQHGHKSIDFQRTYFNSSERRRAESALELVGLSDKAHLTAASLDILGQKLLMIAVAIATDPQLLLLDEPVGGLIPREIEQVEQIIRKLTHERDITIILIEHVMRFLTGLSDEILIMNFGEKLFQGSPDDLASDKKVIDVYLGEGVSGKIGSVRKDEVKNSENGLESVADESNSLKLHESDKWSIDVESFARKLCQQYFNGRLYPIDYMELEKLLEERGEDDRPTRVSRATRRVIHAKKIGEVESQTFELLRTVLEEEQNVRGTNMIFSNREKPKLDFDNKSLRLKTLEEATKRILDSESRQGNVGGKEIEELRAAYLFKPSVDEKILNKSEKMDNG
jgi:branched-chain amino acid transport system ATP-binding protein